MRPDHEFYGMVSDMAVDGARQWLRDLFPEPPPEPEIWIEVSHPVWRRGSLVSHQPVDGATIEWRCGRLTADGIREAV